MIIQPTTAEAEGCSFVSTWSNMSAGDVGAPVRFAGASDRTVQVTGTFSGGSLVIEGSLDGTNYATLTDPQGNALTLSTAKIEAVSELVRFIRPNVTGGDGSTAINVNILMRSTL